MNKVLVEIFDVNNAGKKLGAYVSDFGCVPRVGDYIGASFYHENSFDCQVIQVILIPKHKYSGDVDAWVKAIRVPEIRSYQES